MIYYTTKKGQIIDENNQLIPMDESSPLYKDYYNYLVNEGTVYSTDFLTPEEIEDEQNQINLELKKQAHEQLKETDWYITRFAETGKPIPNEILQQRQLIRDSV